MKTFACIYFKKSEKFRSESIEAQTSFLNGTLSRSPLVLSSPSISLTQDLDVTWVRSKIILRLIRSWRSCCIAAGFWSEPENVNRFRPRLLVNGCSIVLLTDFF